MNKACKGVLGCLGAVCGLAVAGCVVANEAEEAARPHEEGEGFYGVHVKRPLDFALALAGSLALSPLMGATALAVRVGLGSPVLYKQERPGRDGKIFTINKFRTMTNERDAQGNLLPNDDRLTPFGRHLRQTSLDELPEILNILAGDMAIVGPRPLLVKYLPLYNAEQARRHEVRPGLTGYAQVHGRNSLDWQQRFKDDVWYVDHVSLGLDAKILAQTVAKVVRHDDVFGRGGAMLTPFTGNGPRDETGAAPEQAGE